MAKGPSKTEEDRRKRSVERARALGLKLSDEAAKVDADELLNLHRFVSYYVFDVWEALTGSRAKFQLNDRFALDPLVTSFFEDMIRVRRIAEMQMRRDSTANARVEEEERRDPDLHVYKQDLKPPLKKDDDFFFVQEALHKHYPQFIRGRSFWSRLFGS